MNEASFQQLKDQIVRGDERGLQFVFEQTSRYCVRTLLKKTRCEPADAEDIFMDAILIFRENMISGKLVQLSNLKTYLFGICWNVWRDLNRSRAKWDREQDEVERQMWLLEPEVSPLFGEDEEFVKQRIRLVTDALNQLSSKCKQLLTYVYVEQRSQKEIASLMEFASPGVVKVTRHRCYQQWVKRIEDPKTQQTHG